MIATNLINDTLPVLLPDDTCEHALALMKEFNVKHLPLVENKQYVGILSEQILQDVSDPAKRISESNITIKKPSVEIEQHVYDIVRVISEEELSVLPVINDRGEYAGVITANGLVPYLSKVMALDHPGGVIILELNIHDYQLSEIAHIVESNNAQIIHLFVVSNSDSTKLEVNIKLNQFEIEPILQTFRRYNYSIKGAYFEKTDFENLKVRYDALINYLNI